MMLESTKEVSQLARDIRNKLVAKADSIFFKVLTLDKLYGKERIPSAFKDIEDSLPGLKQ